MKYSIGIDIGGTKIAAGIVDSEGLVLHKKSYSTPNKTSTEILKLLGDIVTALESYAYSKKIDIHGIGVGSAGQIDFKNGTVLSGTDNIRNWNNIKLVDFLRKFTSTPIYLDNDANAFAAAEYLLGNGKGSNSLVCITIGTGIGGGVILDGKILHGEWGGASELGHMTVDINGPNCNCGSKGCIETYSSGTGIANRMKEKLKTTKTVFTGDLAFINENLDVITSKEVFQLYQSGLDEATEVIDTAVEALSYGVINFIHLFNPSKIVFGGGVLEKNKWLLNSIKEQVKSKGMSALVDSCELVFSGLGYDSGLIGAAHQVWLND